jgi:hypothetical protein
MKKTLRCLPWLPGLLLAAGTLGAELDPGLWISPNRLHELYRRQGPAAVDKSLRRTPDGWQYVMANIAEGSVQWMDIAGHMRHGLRGAAYRDWVKAMSQALEVQPRRVLIVATRRDLKDICAPENEHHLSLNSEIAAHHIGKLVKAVRSVRLPIVEPKRRYCLQRLAWDRSRLPYLYSEP